MPVRAWDAEPPFEVKLTLPVKTPVAVGLNRTTTVWLAPGKRVNEPPEATLNGAPVDAVPLSVLPPVFVTARERSFDPPTATDPKLEF